MFLQVHPKNKGGQTSQVLDLCVSLSCGRNSTVQWLMHSTHSSLLRKLAPTKGNQANQSIVN